MSRELFLVILNIVRDYDDYFEAKYDYTGKIGFTSYRKCSAAVRQLAYGVSGDLIDDYMRMSESTCHEAMYRFCEDVIAVFGEYYLRETNMDDPLSASCPSTRVGFFLGCLAALTACISNGRTVILVDKGSSKGIRKGAPLYWRLLPHKIFRFGTPFFGMAGSNNDINVLHRSLVFSRLTECTAPQISYEINVNPYDKGYYLADGIYPSWATFVKTMRNPADEKCKRFAK
jgi:hypothetical protein